MTRVFIAGGTGAVGRQLVPLLVAAGHHVTGGSRTPAGVKLLRSLGAAGTFLDVFDRDAVGDVLAAAEPEVVIHQLTSLAGGNPAENARIRKEGTRNLVDAAQKAGVRKVIAQSISWVYEPGSGPADETTPLDTGAPAPRADTVSGVTALEGAAAEIAEHVILRYGLFYGPGTWYAPGDLMARRLIDGALPAHGGVSSFVHVADAARAALLALDWPAGPVNITDDEPAPARAWVPALAAALGVPAPEPSEGGAAWERGADNALARARGWQPGYPTWRTGFAHQE